MEVVIELYSGPPVHAFLPAIIVGIIFNVLPQKDLNGPQGPESEGSQVGKEFRNNPSGQISGSDGE